MHNTQNRGFTLVELLVVIAIISVLAGLLIPTIMKARGSADKVACLNNLRELQKLGMMYADSSGTNFYPKGPGSNPPAHESLNLLVRESEGLQPRLFTCRTWLGEEAEKDSDGHFILDEESCSYTWPSRKIGSSDRPDTPLSCDKYVKTDDGPGYDWGGHPDGRNVVFLDTSVEFIRTEDIPEDELPKGLIQ